MDLKKKDPDPKPQIRIANPYTYFNITNYALFENIDFTGEDLFAEITRGSEGGFMQPWGAMGFFPSTKCTVKEEPKTTFDNLKFKTGMNPSRTNPEFQYRCTTGVDTDTMWPPYEVDDRCFPEYNAIPVT